MKSQLRIMILLAILMSALQPKPAAAQPDNPAQTGLPPLQEVSWAVQGLAQTSDSNSMPGSAVNRPPDAPTAAVWYNGPIAYSTVINCASIILGNPYTEAGAGAYVGFRVDLAANQPGPNQTYYIHIVIGGIGNPCPGTLVYPEISLPANTTFAFDAAHLMYCYYDSTAVACPSQLLPSIYNPGAYSIPGDPKYGNTWPLAQGHFLEFQMPVQSSTILSGAVMTAHVWVIDGNDSPWLHPTQGVYVFSNTPTLFYPYPSSDSITKTTAKSYVTLVPAGQSGTLRFEIGLDTGYSSAFENVPIAAGTPAQTYWEDWTGLGGFSLQPGTTYHWRAGFLKSGGNIIGSDQTFTTLPDGQAIVGNGAAASCTETALNDAFAVPNVKQIFFDCGTLPITITLTTAKTVGGNLTIDGNNKVTLLSNGSDKIFSVLGGMKLTLNKITLSGGANDSGCGGAVYLTPPAQLWTNQARFLNNHALNGGAICQGAGSYTYLVQSLLKNNHALADGGAIYDSGGTIEIVDTDISNNSADPNTGSGGGIRNAGDLFLTRSLVASNTASAGGGLNVAGNAVIETSTVSSNGAVDGAGIYHSGASLSVNNSTIAFNYSTKTGPLYFTGIGGMDEVGTSALVKNSLIANNPYNNCNTSQFVTVFTSDGGNLDSDGSCHLNLTSDIKNVNPLLGSLANNGGATRTHALLNGSPAIDKAVNANCLSPDQRGNPRPIGANCDIGAFEYKPTLFLPLITR